MAGRAEIAAPKSPVRIQVESTGAVARASLRAAQSTLDSFAAEPANAARIETVADVIASCFAAGNKVLICGNGGSMADAMHFAEELTGRFRADRPALPALACTDPGHITCTANDYGFEHVFSRWVEALGREGDVLIVLSTSGNSANILKSADAARTRGLHTVALLGRDGGKLAGVCDHQWIVAGEHADRIQEVHMLVLHTLIECIEHKLGHHPQ